ncbi:hypothetical protein HDU67_004188 [Dinochytrium kinnereticum]|nr:hypothetical protein HDU67_004188 [Dinochytrium kinnereticum]
MTEHSLQDPTTPTTRVGQRIETTEGHRGTILYQGPIPQDTTADHPTGPTWLGIEWDDPSRGKHSGTHKGVELFQTRFKNAGSFVKQYAAKLRFPRPFLSALGERYLPDETEMSGIVETGLAALRGEKRGEDVKEGVVKTVERSGHVKLGDKNVVVEMVGWEEVSRRQSKVWRLREISLAGMEVGWIGSEVPGLLGMICPSVVDLDLSRNLFSRWAEVAMVCCELPALESLRLNQTRLWWWCEENEGVAFPPSFDPRAVIKGGAFDGVKALALNHTRIPWAEVEGVVARHFPALEELHLGFNGMTNLTSSTDHLETALFPNLKLLNLESNLLTSWDDVASIAKRLPSLKNLHLPNNQIPSISTTLILPTLLTLNLSQNRISDWLSLHALNTITPALKDLRFKSNPITSDLEHPRTDLLFHLIARVANVDHVNGSPISLKDRRDAEWWYLNRCAMENPQTPNFTSTHPRYATLVSLHGEPTIAPVSATSTALKHRMVQLTLVSVLLGSPTPDPLSLSPFLMHLPDDASPVLVKEVVKKVPVGMTVRSLRALMGRLVVLRGGVGSGECVGLEAWVFRGGKWLNPFGMGDELREVGFYDLGDGDCVRMLLR